MEQAFGQAEYFDQTTLHPLGLTALLALGLLLVALPRRWALLPVIVMACFVAPAQRIMIVGLNFDLMRMLVLIGFARVVVRGEIRTLKWKPLDTAVTAWALAGTLAYTILWQSTDALVYQMGWKVFDGLFAYAVFRALVRDWADVRRAALAFAVVSVPVAMAFAVERATGRNAFAALGGVPEITVERNGRLRCQGAFAHPILAGVFWASVLPMMGALWFSGLRWRWAAVVGLVCGLGIIMASASSTPLSAVILAGAAFAMWPLRDHMKAIRWGTLALLTALHLSMKNPVWHLLARVDFVGGSTGWHRFFLMDEFIRQVGQWWAVGMRGLLHEDLFDITNQYVLEGIDGGLITLGLFVWIIVRAFAGAGRLRKVSAVRTGEALMAWGLGVALWVHVTSFIAVSYFGQIKALWALQLAIVASMDPGKAAVARLTVGKRAGRSAPGRGPEPVRPLPATGDGAGGVMGARSRVA